MKVKYNMNKLMEYCMIDELLAAELAKYECGKFINNVYKPNKIQFPISVIDFADIDGVESFNNIMLGLYNNELSMFTKTKSGGISLKKNHLNCYNYYVSFACIEVIIMLNDLAWRIQVRTKKPIENGITGRKAFIRFKELCVKYKIDLESFAVKNGKEIKETIEKPMISITDDCIPGVTYNNVHHIDYHSSYPSGLVMTHPEFYPVIDLCYSKRTENSNYKAILNYTIGFMQSIGGCNARYAVLSRDAIKDNNDRIRSMTEKLKKTGHTVLCYNTDGLWYTGDVYHDEDEGTDLYTYSNDHVNCKWRCKSAGCYEFIEDDKYTPVVRGTTKLDKLKPRDEWSWGNIFDCGDVFTFEAVYMYDKKIIQIRRNNNESN